MADLDYSIGKVSIAAGATIATFTDATLVGNAKKYDTLEVDGVMASVRRVIDATHLAITKWKGPTVTAASYTLLQTSPQRLNTADPMTEAFRTLASLSKSTIIVPPEASAPDPALGNEGQYALQPTSLRFWKVVDGEWVYQGGPATRFVNKVATFGDSITAEGFYQRRLIDNLGTDWIAINRGLGGQYTSDMAARFSADILAVGDIKVLCILCGTNNLQVCESLAHPSGYTLSNVVSLTTTDIQTMCTAARAVGFKTAVATILPFGAHTNWSPAKQSRLESINDFIMRTCADVDYRIDAYGAFLDARTPYTGKVALMSPEHLHPSAQGYVLLGDLFFKGAIWSPAATVPAVRFSREVTLIDQDLASDSHVRFKSVTTDNVTVNQLHTLYGFPTAQSGAFGDASYRMEYFDYGPVRFVDVTIMIVAKGSADGFVRVQLPSVAGNMAANFHGREMAAAGFSLSAYAAAGGTDLIVTRTDSNSPIIGSARLCVQGWYRK